MPGCLTENGELPEPVQESLLLEIFRAPDLIASEKKVCKRKETKIRKTISSIFHTENIFLSIHIILWVITSYKNN